MRKPVVVLFALLVVFALAAPAQAAPAFITVGAGVDCGYQQTATCNGVAQGVLVGVSGMSASYVCAAVTKTTVGVVAETGIQCWLRGRDDDAKYAITEVRFVPGQAAFIGKGAQSVPLQSYDLCVRAGWLKSNGEFHAVQGTRSFEPIPG